MSSFCNSVEGFGGTADSSQFVRPTGQRRRERALFRSPPIKEVLKNNHTRGAEGRWALAAAAIAPFEVELLSLAQFSGRMMVWRELQALRGREREEERQPHLTFYECCHCRATAGRKKERKKEERTAAFFFCNLIASLRNVNRLPAIPLKTRPRLTPSLFWHARRVEPPRFTPVSNETHFVPQMHHICFALISGCNTFVLLSF